MDEIETPHELVLINRFARRPRCRMGGVDRAGPIRAMVEGARLAHSQRGAGSATAGPEQEFRQTGVITDEHFAALKVGTIDFFEQLKTYLEN